MGNKIPNAYSKCPTLIAQVSFSLKGFSFQWSTVTQKNGNICSENLNDCWIRVIETDVKMNLLEYSNVKKNLKQKFAYFLTVNNNTWFDIWLLWWTNPYNNNST